MNEHDELSYGGGADVRHRAAARDISRQAQRHVHTRLRVSQAFVDRYIKHGPVSALIPTRPEAA